MDISGLMVSTSNSHWGSRRSFPGRRAFEFAFQLLWDGTAEKMGEQCSGKVGDSLFYSRVGDTGWDQLGDHLFVSDAHQQNEGAWWVQDIFVWPRRWRDFPSLELRQAVRNVVGCRSVWILQSQTDLRWKLVTCGRPVYQVVAEFSTCVLWPLMIWLMMVLWVIMLWFHSWGVDAILGCGYGI